MNDSAIKTFCTQAREMLEQGVERRMRKYGIVPDCAPDANASVVGDLPLSPVEREQRGALLRLQSQLGEGDASLGHERLLERAAYTWFNRMVAIRFMELRDYLAKATPDTLPVATQLFTPEWIVRYMVQNSLGRLWMLNNPQSAVRQQMEYYIEPDSEHEDFIRISGPEEITLCDPACGSGHILVYAFELLFAMYEERGYREREIPQLILQNNLSGLEIDPRAAQIASLALAMCAREHDRRFFGRGVRADVNVVAPTDIAEEELPEKSVLLGQPQLLEALAHLDEIGSLLNPSEAELSAVRADAEAVANAAEAGDMFAANAAEKLQQARAICKLLSRRYACVVANPPYMGSSSFSPFMSKWVKKNYPDVKSDLFSAFIVRNMSFAKEHGECGIMCPFVWMFIGSYEKLRQQMIEQRTITSLIQLEYSGFAGATVPICTFTFHNSHIDDYEGGYVRLSDFVGPENQAPKALEAIQNPTCGWFYRRDAQTFTQIPGTPIAYWVGASTLNVFSSMPRLAGKYEIHAGVRTGENDRFLRSWWETGETVTAVGRSLIKHGEQSDFKWFPCNKGGGYRRWYGNNWLLINWENDGEEIRNHPGSDISPTRKMDWLFSSALTWGSISSGGLSFRYCPEGFMFTDKGPGLLSKTKDDLLLAAGLLNSIVTDYIQTILSPTLDFHEGQLGKTPAISSAGTFTDEISGTVTSSIDLSKFDWDSFETSWDFKRHPLL